MNSAVEAALLVTWRSEIYKNKLCFCLNIQKNYKSDNKAYKCISTSMNQTKN